uniref:Longitudinals lacking protein-like n=1 Tax=Caligus rogercresseyi TaxID=217165 RepID=C1BPR1_CALRO|nr:Longitudinals lacking protein-like [Caligus rogercresseyi]
MGSLERLLLRWNDFESNIKLGFSELRQDEDFFDVTLACESKQVKAHKVILSACSPFFRSLIKSVSHAHPLLYLRGIKFAHLEALLSFMYNGEVSVTQEELAEFLSIAEELKVKGLSATNPSSGEGGREEVNSSKEGPLPKRPRTNPKASNQEPITILDDDDDDDDQETNNVPQIQTMKLEEEKFIPATEAPLNSSESTYGGQEFHHEKVFQSEDFGQEGGNMDYGEEEMNMAQDMPGMSGIGNTNENKELNEKLNDEINRLIKKTSEGLYQCIPCKKTTKRLQNLQFHVESLHVITDGFECKICGTVLKTRQYYRQHPKKHEKSPKYIPTR